MDDKQGWLNNRKKHRLSALFFRIDVEKCFNLNFVFERYAATRITRFRCILEYAQPRTFSHCFLVFDYEESGKSRTRCSVSLLPFLSENEALSLAAFATFYFIRRTEI